VANFLSQPMAGYVLANQHQKAIVYIKEIIAIGPELSEICKM